MAGKASGNVSSGRGVQREEPGAAGLAPLALHPLAGERLRLVETLGRLVGPGMRIERAEGSSSAACRFSQPKWGGNA